MKKILLFIPFYNCEKQIIRVLNQAQKYQNLFSKILVVDNQSIDNGLDAAKKFINENQLKNFVLIQNTKNYNLGGSHKIAFNYCLENDYDHIVVFHGDDQGNLSDLVPLIQMGDHLKYDCLLGARFHPESRLIGYSKHRRLGNIILNLFCSFALDSKILDMGSGINMYKRSFVSDERIMKFPNDLTFNVYLLFHSYLNQKSIKFFPISWREEDQISNAKVFKQFQKIILLIVMFFVSKKNLYKFSIEKKYTYDVISEY